jgi:multiple sugar transport system permease protein
VTSVSTRGSSSRSLSAGTRRQAFVAWGFALPFLLVFGAFLLVPILWSFVMSFTDMRSSDLRSPFSVNFVGLDQYVTLFTDARFIQSLVNTFYFVGVGIPLTIIAGLALAVALNSGINRFRAAFRVGFYTPVVTSIVAVAVVWRFILQPDGLLNAMLAWVGIDGPNWLQTVGSAMPALIFMKVWLHMGNLMIIFLAGLQTISPELLEAAKMDGAGAWRRFTSVTLPLLRPTILLGAVLLSVSYLQFFEEPFVMTQGGPLGTTMSVSYFTFNEFGFGKYGYASAASYVLFICIALLSLLQFRLLRSKD